MIEWSDWETKSKSSNSSDKLARYQAKTEQCVQNRMFLTNQLILLERLEKENRSYDLRPRNQKVVNFWSGIWDLPVR